MLVFLLSFVFQTAYSITFKVSSVQSSDYQHKHVDKTTAKEETSENSFIEKEKEKDNEFDYELLTFIVPYLVFQLECSTSNEFTSSEKKIRHLTKESIFIIVRSIRI